MCSWIPSYLPSPHPLPSPARTLLFCLRAVYARHICPKGISAVSSSWVIMGNVGWQRSTATQAVKGDYSDLWHPEKYRCAYVVSGKALTLTKRRHTCTLWKRARAHVHLSARMHNSYYQRHAARNGATSASVSSCCICLEKKMNIEKTNLHLSHVLWTACFRSWLGRTHAGWFY